jgi:transcriptional regulator with XRE-family HTH domain
MLTSIHSEEWVKLAKWLREQREAKGLTMRDLAAKLEVPHSFVGKIEQRERRLDVVEYLIYCEALEVSPMDGLRAIRPSL